MIDDWWLNLGFRDWIWIWICDRWDYFRPSAIWHQPHETENTRRSSTKIEHSELHHTSRSNNQRFLIITFSTSTNKQQVTINNIFHPSNRTAISILYTITMSAPVVTSKWAGNFDCSVCRRKRLMAEEFSKSSLEKHRKSGQAMRCKQCTAKQEQEKRAAKAGTTSSNNDANDNDNETRTCAGPCHRVLKKDAYNRNQWSKPVGKSRCRECVEKAIQEESNQQKIARTTKSRAFEKRLPIWDCPRLALLSKSLPPRASSLR